MTEWRPSIEQICRLDSAALDSVLPGIERGHDELLDDLIYRPPMVAPIFAHGRGGRRYHRQLEAGDKYDVLSAEPPRVVRLAAGHVAHPPAVTVLTTADPRPPARLERLIDEVFRQNVTTAHLSAIAIHLAKRQHLPRRH